MRRIGLAAPAHNPIVVASASRRDHPGMGRRVFLSVVGGSMLATSLAAEGQQAERLRRIGVLMGYAETDPAAQANVEAFREGLQKLEWVEGRNIRIDIRWPIPADLESIQ